MLELTWASVISCSHCTGVITLSAQNLVGPFKSTSSIVTLMLSFCSKVCTCGWTPMLELNQHRNLLYHNFYSKQSFLREASFKNTVFPTYEHLVEHLIYSVHFDKSYLDSLHLMCTTQQERISCLQSMLQLHDNHLMEMQPVDQCVVIRVTAKTIIYKHIFEQLGILK